MTLLTQRMNVRGSKKRRKPGPSLDLTPEERKSLRKVRIKLADLAQMTPVHLAAATEIPVERCEALVVLSQFQQLPSIGKESSKNLWLLGFRSINSLIKADPIRMYDQFCDMVGHRVDPCVEDVFRCAVAQARNPDMSDEERYWWHWTEFRGTEKIDP